MDEKYTSGGNDGTDLLMVAIHEIGHSLGLDHNNANGSIMNPYYTGHIPNFKLFQHDIMLIQDLYGPPQHSTVNPTITASKITTPSTKPTTTSSRPITTTGRHSSVTTKPNGPTTLNPKIADLPTKLYCLTGKKPVMMCKF